MPDRGLEEIIGALESVAGAEVDWKPLRDALPGLRERLEWLRRQADTLPAPLVAVLYGGTGAGKSTLLNALAGAPVALVGSMRPTTERPTVYHPLEYTPELGDGDYVASGHLDELVLVDLPDTDSVKLEHRGRVAQLLGQADVVLFCGTQQKYKNEQSIALLRPYVNERKLVCVQTRADQDPDIREDWLLWLRGEGFDVNHCYRISASNAFARKQGGDAGEEYDFPELEQYLRDKLPPERAAIKAQNIRGAARNTTHRLLRDFYGREQDLAALDEKLGVLEAGVARAALGELQARLLNEPHVWVVAMGEAVSERSFGLIGLLYRIVHGLRMLPSRLTGRFSLAGLLQSAGGRAEPGPGAVQPAPPDDAFLRELTSRFKREHAEANAYLARAGLTAVDFAAWQQEFVEELRARLANHLEPVQQRLNKRARRLTGLVLPLLDVMWLAPLAFTLGVPLYNYYWNLVSQAQIVLPEQDFMGRSAAMIGVVIFSELAAFALLVRIAGRLLGRRSRRELARQMEDGGFGFGPQRAAVRAAQEVLANIRRISSTP